MKKLLRTLCLFCVAIISLFAVACSTATSDSGISGTNDTDAASGGGFVATGDGSDTSTGEKTTTTTETEIADAIDYDFEGLSQDTDYTDATEIAETEEAYTIKAAGDYVLSGTYAKGVTVKKDVGEVHIFLNNATITCDGDSALAVKKGNTVTITVVDGTTNSIESTASDSNGIKSNGDLAINGKGTLNVVSTTKNGIKVDGALIITDATINVTAVNHAISAYNVNAKDCTLNVTTNNNGEAKDGLHAEIEDPETEDDISSIVWTEQDGYIVLNNVNYTANVEGDGIQADTFVYIDGGTYNITTTAKFVQYSSANMETYDLVKDDFRYRLNNGVYYKQASDSQVSSGSYAMIQSSKGIKVGEIDYEVKDADDNVIASGEVASDKYYIIIENGTFTINSADDGIHANSGNVTLNGGDITIETLDDGITSDYSTKIQGGTITVNYCYEGIEGSYVEINGGTVKLNYCRDDGINAASDYNVTEYIKITGGDIYVNAYGDGIDSNGSITVSGGKVFVDGPSDNGNGSLDSETGIYINGGYVVAVGSSAWVNEATPKTSSAQYSLVYAGNTVSAGTTLTLKDASGNTIVSFKTAKASSSVVISAPEITAGTYTLYAGSGTLTTFNVSSKVTTVGANSQGGMGGGMGGPGGRPNFR